MNQYSMFDISMSDIKLFAMLARERSFTRAARMADVTQPTLSRRISQMETILGIRLFDRDSRPVMLTAEGETLYKDCQPVLSQFEHAVSAARAIGQVHGNAIAIGAPDSGNEVISLPTIAGAMLRDHPDMGVTMRYLSLSEWRSRVLSGEVDVFVTALFEACDLPAACTFARITDCPKDIVMLAGNPLARREVIAFSDLETQRFVMISPEESPAYSRYVNDVCGRFGGFTPVLARYVPHANNLVAGVLHDDEVAVCDMFLRDVNGTTHKRFSLPGVRSGLIAVWRKDNENSNIRSFLASLRRHFADNGHSVCDTM